MSNLPLSTIRRIEIIIFAALSLFVLETSAQEKREGKQERKREYKEKLETGALPESLAGFSGQVGVVVEGKVDGPGLIVTVHKVHKVWKNNKADAPKELEGRKIRVVSERVKDDSGKWQKNPLHVGFISAFPVKEDCRIEIKHLEGNYFAILELSERQRELARTRKGDREHKREGEHDRKGDGEHGERHSVEDQIRKLEGELERLRATLRKQKRD